MSIREKFLEQAGQFKKHVVEVEGIGKIEVREPSAQQRSQIYKSATKMVGVGKNATTEIDGGRLNAWAIIYCTYDPDTGARVFDKADLDSLLGMPTSQLDKLAAHAMEFLGEEEDEEGND